MSNLELIRFETDDHATLGELVRDGVRLCYTLENRPPKVEGVKEPGKSRIPPGTYPLIARTIGGFHQRYTERWDWHGPMIEIQLEGWDAVLFHCGNTHHDTAGCVLLGESYGDTAAGLTIFRSRAAYEAVYPVLTDAAMSGGRLVVRGAP